MKISTPIRYIVAVGLWDVVNDMLGLSYDGFIDYNRWISLDMDMCMAHGISLTQLESLLDYIENSNAVQSNTRNI